MKRHQDREKSSKLPDPLRSKAEEVWSGNETTSGWVNLAIPLRHFAKGLLGTHGSASLCRVERENKMAATYMY